MRAELGAHYVKTYCVEDTIASCCPVPIVIAGGKKIPELDALKMARNAIDQGTNGVDMGRNIFQPTGRNTCRTETHEFRLGARRVAKNAKRRIG